MKTVVVKVRIYGPENTLTEGVALTARLQTVGITPTGIGFVDRTFESAVTNALGECDLQLWPSIEGTTGAEYQIVARNPDGSKLFDELVSVPDVDFPIWLHDIILLPPPSTKYYDVEAIKVIIDAKVTAMHARDEAVQAALDARAAVGDAELAATNSAASAGESAASALESAGSAIESAGSAGESAESAIAAGLSAIAAKASEDAAKASELAAKGHADDAQASAEQITGDMTAFDGRVTSVEGRATDLEADVLALQQSGGAGADSRLDNVSADGWTLIRAQNFDAMAELIGNSAATDAAIAQANQNAQAALDNANAVQETVDAIDSNVDALSVRVTAAEADIDTLQSDVETLKDQVENGGGSGGSGSAVAGDFVLKPTPLAHDGWLGAGKYLAETYPNIANLFGDFVYQVSITPGNFVDSGFGGDTLSSRKVYSAVGFGDSQALSFETKTRIVTNGVEQEFAKDVKMTGLSASNNCIMSFAPADAYLPIKFYVPNGGSFNEVSIAQPIQDYLLGHVTLGNIDYLVYRESGKMVKLDTSMNPEGGALQTSMTNLGQICTSRNGRVFSSINAYDADSGTYYTSLYELTGLTWNKIYDRSGTTSVSCENGSDIVYFNKGKSWFDTVSNTFGSTSIDDALATSVTLFVGLNDLFFCFSNQGSQLSTDRGLTFTQTNEISYLQGNPTDACLSELSLRLYGNAKSGVTEATAPNTRTWPLAQGNAFFNVPQLPSPLQNFAYYVKS